MSVASMVVTCERGGMKFVVRCRSAAAVGSRAEEAGLVVGQPREPGVGADVAVGEVLAGPGAAVGDEQRAGAAVLDQSG